MEYVMELEGLTKTFGKKTAVDNFSLKIEKGHICGLIGPNGAGKTTIMRMMAALTEPDSGEMKFFGSTNLDEARSRMSFIIEEPYMEHSMTARENMQYLRFIRGVADESRIDMLLDFVGLKDVGKKKVGKFSLGMRQRLGIAMSLLAKPEFMVLDEPINGLDPEGIIDVRKMLLKLTEEEKITILISSHILKELSELCTDYAIVNHGKLIEKLSHEELLLKTKTFIGLRTNDIGRTCTVLEGSLGIRNYKVSPENEIMIFERLEDLERISSIVTQNNLTITKINVEGESLEDYYIGKVGDQNE
ncbi:MAG: ATP-binding cassette domain-containing protein [Eubacterium sp.]|nr:ATP-binding cassette domain-containing protein [Eubacterium sp.]